LPARTCGAEGSIQGQAGRQAGRHIAARDEYERFRLAESPSPAAEKSSDERKPEARYTLHNVAERPFDEGSHSGGVGRRKLALFM